MMPCVDLDQWHDLFVAGAGAGAALAGLIIVAVSVNIETILKYPSMTSRAGTAVAGSTLILIVACAALIPDQAPWVLGLEILVLSAVALGLVLRSVDNIIRQRGEEIAFGTSVMQASVGVIPIVVMLFGGLLLTADLEAGLYIVAVAIIVGFAAAVTYAWVLLVEVLR
jgi:modulator of FtsH protease